MEPRKSCLIESKWRCCGHEDKCQVEKKKQQETNGSRTGIEERVRSLNLRYLQMEEFNKV